MNVPTPMEGANMTVPIQLVATTVCALILLGILLIWMITVALV